MLDISSSDYAVLTDSHFEAAKNDLLQEFGGVTNNQAYKHAFARLLKKDPEARVLMLGTDQRDLFIPVFAKLADAIPQNGHFFDVGGGDGQTFALIGKNFARKGATVSVIEPNPDYTKAYKETILNTDGLKLGSITTAGFEKSYEGLIVEDLPEPESQDLLAGIHMLYFMEPERAALEMYDYLKPGGSMFIVFADETVSHTGQCVRAFYNATGQQDSAARNLGSAQKLKNLFGSPEQGHGRILESIRNRFGEDAAMTSVSQDSRLYGSTLADIIALGLITELAPADGQPFDLSKIDRVSAFLNNNSHLIRVETDGPRKGMLSVSQPQIVTVITKPRAPAPAV